MGPKERCPAAGVVLVLGPLAKQPQRLPRAGAFFGAYRIWRWPVLD